MTIPVPPVMVDTPSVAAGSRAGGDAPGAVIAGIAAFREPVAAARLIFAGLLPAGIIGPSLTAQKAAV